MYFYFGSVIIIIYFLHSIRLFFYYFDFRTFTLQPYTVSDHLLAIITEGDWNFSFTRVAHAFTVTYILLQKGQNTRSP